MRLGIGVGWQEIEYEAMGEDFHTRGARMDEAIALMRAYWGDAQVEYSGKHYRAHAMAMEPKPPQGRPSPDLDRRLLGGRLPPRGPARRRLARQPRHRRGECQARAIESIRRHAEAAGRDPAGIGLQSMVAPPPRDAEGKRFYAEPDRVVARAAALQSMGFQWVSLNATAMFQAGARSVDAMIEALEPPPRAPARRGGLSAMHDLTLGRLRISAVVERAGPTRPTWLLPDATPEAVERHRDWLAPHFLDDKGRFLQSIHAFVIRAPGFTALGGHLRGQ